MPVVIFRRFGNWLNASAPVTERDTSPVSETAGLALELEGELRLHPLQMNLGRAELLTDALTLPFTDIESRLGRYALNASPDQRAALVRSMKGYLGRLNANPHIPLSFRLKVLNRFEQELDLFDVEMTAAVLNAHKVGVLLVQQAARKDCDYYPMLIDMVANAMELATRLLRMNLAQYRSPVVIVTRQFFDLARLGLGVAALMGEQAPSKRERLYRAVSNHELLRKLDMFSHDESRQQQIWQELQYHVGALKPRLMHAGETIDGKVMEHADASIWMLINLNRPNDPGRMLTEPPDTIDYDSIVIAMDALIERVKKAVFGVEAIMADRAAQRKSLHTEQALEHTLAGGRALLAALHEGRRSTDRKHEHGAGLMLNSNAAQSLTLASQRSGDPVSEEEPADTPRWTLIDSSAGGICLECMESNQSDLQPGTLVGLRWQMGEQGLRSDYARQPGSMPALAWVRWVRVERAGDQRIGLSFIEPGYKQAKAVVIGANQEMDQKRTWPVLVRPGEREHEILFPDTGIYRQMTFMLLQGRQQAHFRISEIIRSGSNYTLCRMTHARTAAAKR